jgi:EmrB/QacA subfamily drug resistance transporter
MTDATAPEPDLTLPARKLRNPPAEWLHAHRRSIFGVMLVAWVMTMLDASIVNIAIPELQRQLDADVPTATWVINAYNLAFAVLLVPMGRLADQFGRRRMFVAGMIVFTIASALCAASPTVSLLIAARAIQGAGAGMLAPLGFAMAVLVFPPARRGFALTLIAGAALLANASGPLLGGTLIELIGWQAIFVVNVPVGIVVIVLARRWWPETTNPAAAGQRVDWLGMALLGGAVCCLVLTLNQGNRAGWGSLDMLWLAQLTLLLGAGFWASQRFRAAPMIPHDLAANRRFRDANIAMLLFGAGFIGALLMLSLVFVDLWGYSPIEAGLALTPVPLAGFATWPIAARSAGKVPLRTIAVPALGAVLVGLLWLSALPAVAHGAGDYLILLPGLILVGAGMGVAFPTINVGAMSAVPPAGSGIASGVLNTSRQLGAALGVAILVAVVITVTGIGRGAMSDDVHAIARDYAISEGTVDAMAGGYLAGFAGAAERQHDLMGFDERIADRAAGNARDGFAWAFRVAALGVLAALLLIRRKPEAEAAQAELSSSSASTTRSAARPSP